MGRSTGVEPATSGTTIPRSNQLSYNRHTEIFMSTIFMFRLYFRQAPS